MPPTTYTCYRWHGQTSSLTDARRGSMSDPVPPRLVADWARKPFGTDDLSRDTKRSPEDAIAWLRDQTASSAGKHRYPRTPDADNLAAAQQLVPEAWFASGMECITAGTALHWEFPLVGGMTLAVAVLPGE